MIALNDMRRQLCALLQKETGVFATAARVQGTQYPAYFVQARPAGTVIIAGGRQIERTVSVTVTAYADRERDSEAQAAMLEAVCALVLPSFAVCGRRFSPQKVEADEADGAGVMRFEIVFCDLPGTENGSPSDRMDSLALDLA